MVAAYNNVPQGAVARGAFGAAHMPAVLRDYAHENIQTAAVGQWTDNYFHGYSVDTFTAVQTGSTGWFLLHDGAGKNLDTLTNHPGTFDGTTQGIFMVLANVQVPSVGWAVFHDVPAQFGMLAIGYEADLGAGLAWHLIPVSQAVVNNYNTFGIPNRAIDIDPEELDVALMGILDLTPVPLGTTIRRFGVFGCSAYAAAPLRTMLTWKFGSMQVFHFKPGALT